MRRQRRSIPREAGLTLVELMVSMVLAVMLSAGLFYVMSGQQKTYNIQLASMTSQENLWSAMEYLQGQVRKAGYGFAGCLPDFTNALNSPTLMMWDSGSTASPQVKAYATALVVENNSNAFTGTTGGSDTLRVAYAEDTGASALTAVRTVTSLPDAAQAVLSVNAPGTIQNGDLLVLWQHGSLKHCTVVQATGAPAVAGTFYQIPYAAGTGNAYNPPVPQHINIFPQNGGYAAQSLVMRVGSATNSLVHSFAIDNSVPRNPPRLVTWRGSNTAARQVVAEGIEDMQISWACDVNNDGLLFEGNTPSAQLTDEWAYNAPGEAALPNCGTNNIPIGAVRITLIARTSGPTSSKVGFRPGAEDRPAGTSAQDQILTGNLGTFGRAVLTTVVKPRNIQRSVQ